MEKVIKHMVETMGLPQAFAEQAVAAYHARFGRDRKMERVDLPEDHDDHMDADLVAEDVVSWYGTPASHR